jgi:CRP-like cAMP-binding protein
MNPFIVQMERRDRFSPEEKAALAAAGGPPRNFAAGEDIFVEGERPRVSTLVVKGFAGRYNTLRNGERQISALNLPGDFMDLHSFTLHVMDHSARALTHCTVVQFPHEALTAITERFPHLTRILWLSTVIDAAIYRRWLVAMGRQPSVAQLAHLLCELHVRLGLVGLVEADAYDLPLSQAELGDVLGLSLVHVNRLVQELKRSGFVAWNGKRVKIVDLERLRALAQFDPTYLHLAPEPR